MMKKTLHTTIAAIAVSTICLSAADAAAPKKNLILDFEAMSHDFVGKNIWQPAMYGDACIGPDPRNCDDED